MVFARVVVAFAVLTACAGTVDAPQIEPAVVAAYSPRIGDVWTFVNGYGDTTVISTEAAPDPVACRSGRNVVWHYRKSNARAYWLPGIESAEILFVLHQNPDSSWRSTASVISVPHSCPWCDGAKSFTWDILDNQPGDSLGYQIVPPALHRADHIVADTRADAAGGPGLFTLDCVVPDGHLVTPAGHGASWRTDFYMEDVVTPVYTGPASVSEQWENCNATRTNVECGHEKWWFAPRLGLVKVWQITDPDPKITMVRIH